MEHNGIALLIDADNCPASKITVILDELSKYGVINIRRAYGDWKSQTLNGWAEILHDHAIQPVQQFAYTKRKNATDSAIIIDAMDYCTGKSSAHSALLPATPISRRWPSGYAPAATRFSASAKGRRRPPSSTPVPNFCSSKASANPWQQKQLQ